MSLVAIIGAGDLGAACAQSLAARDRVSQVLFVDEAVTAASGKALDIQQSGAVDGFHTRLRATDDSTAVMHAAVCVIADRLGPPVREWSGDEALAMIRRAASFLGNTPIVFAGTQPELMLHTAREVLDGSETPGFPDGVGRRRLIGSSPEAYASAVRSIVAMEAGCSPAEVMLAILGVPGERGGHGLVVPWSEASIAGYALERSLTPVQLTRIAARAARLWPPGPYTLGIAAARIAEAIVTSSRSRFNALTILGGEFGVRNRIGALPVLLNTQGIASRQVPVLNTRERVLVETALGL